MNVRLYVCRLDDNGTPVEVVEDYTVPHGSWVQTEAAGAQPVPPVLEPAARRYRSGALGGQEYAIVWQPVNPPFVPERLLKLLKGRDRRFGRNGAQYMGSYRARGGGMPYDRARSYASWYRFYVLQWEDGDRAAEARAEWPVALSEEEVAMILEWRGAWEWHRAWQCRGRSSFRSSARPGAAPLPVDLLDEGASRVSETAAGGQRARDAATGAGVQWTECLREEGGAVVSRRPAGPHADDRREGET
jgi:hypothetical protein